MHFHPFIISVLHTSSHYDIIHLHNTTALPLSCSTMTLPTRGQRLYRLKTYSHGIFLADKSYFLTHCVSALAECSRRKKRNRCLCVVIKTGDILSQPTKELNLPTLLSNTFKIEHERAKKQNRRDPFLYYILLKLLYALACHHSFSQQTFQSLR